MDFIEKGKKSSIWRTNGTKIRLTGEYFACQFHYTLLLYATNYWNSIYEQEWHMFVLWHKPFWFMQQTYLVREGFFSWHVSNCPPFKYSAVSVGLVLYFLLNYWTANGTRCIACNIPYIKPKFKKWRKAGSLSLQGKKETDCLHTHVYKWNSVCLLIHSINIYYKCLLCTRVKPGRRERVNKTALRMNAVYNSDMNKILEDKQTTVWNNLEIFH